MSEINFDCGKLRVTKDGNTLGTCGDYEALTVEAETQLPGESPFFVIRTEGWSFDSIDELTELLKSLTVHLRLETL